MPILDLVIYTLSLAVAAVPEGMPAIVTVALALGVQRLAARHALIRKLPSVETLGSVSVICTDKTGTLTTGQMQVREIWGPDKTAVLRSAALCTDAEFDPRSGEGSGDPTEIAILAAAFTSGINLASAETEAPRVSSEPFDTERRRMSVFRMDGRNYVKGAVEAIISLCNDAGSSTVRAVADEMAARGLRVLAVAIGESPAETDLKLVGLLGLADPPRPEAAAAIDEARQAGIVPVMITGDHPSTAAAIARELGLILADDDISKRVHARATPADKLRLVREWKSLGHVVAMTGDGVNDAPALKEAHIGIAMGRAGTEVTRQAADMILADDNFATIVAAVREGRAIFQNIRRALVYLLTGNLAELLAVIGALLLGLPLPLLAAHLLWINLVTDSLPAITLIMEEASPDLMKSPPRPKDEALLGPTQWRWIVGIGLVEALSALLLYKYDLVAASAQHARGLLFTTIVFSQLLRSFSARSTSASLLTINYRGNFWQPAVVVFTGLLQVSLHYLPITRDIFGLDALSAGDFLMIIPVSLVSTIAMELTKLYSRTLAHRPSVDGKAPTKQLG
jgi:Ca2+-transporting ATPase